MRFIVDAQLPPGMCVRLGQLGHQAVHVSDLGRGDLTDIEIADAACAGDWIIITKDEDFISLRQPDRFALLWLRCGNITNQGLSAWLEPRRASVEKLLKAGERMIELR